MAELFPVIGDQILMKRSTASSIHNSDGTLVNLRDFKPAQEIRTVTVERDSPNEYEYQVLHHQYAS